MGTVPKQKLGLAPLGVCPFFALLIVFILLDIFFLKGFTIFGTRPDFTFIFVIFVGLSQGFLYGSGIGFAGGLIKDIFVNVYLGPGAFSLTLTGFLAGILGKRLFYQNILIQVLIVFIATLFRLSLTNMLLNIIHLSPHAGREIISAAFFNALLAPPIFLLLGVAFKK